MFCRCQVRKDLTGWKGWLTVGKGEYGVEKTTAADLHLV